MAGDSDFGFSMRSDRMPGKGEMADIGRYRWPDGSRMERGQEVRVRGRPGTGRIAGWVPSSRRVLVVLGGKVSRVPEGDLERAGGAGRVRR